MSVLSAEELPWITTRLDGLIVALSHDQAITKLALERLDQTATATLAAGLHPDSELDPALETRLWRETEGNPLFVIETLRAGFTADSNQVVLTPTMRAVLSTRLDQLTDDARRLAEIAAVYGRPFPAGLMATAIGTTTESELVDQLDELWRRRIIREHGSRYDFSHDKLRVVTLEAVVRASTAPASGPCRGDDGRGNRRYRISPRSSPQLAATHYDQAGMVAPAIDAYRVSGTLVGGVPALDEAVTDNSSALSLIAELPGSHPIKDALELDIRLRSSPSQPSRATARKSVINPTSEHEPCAARLGTGPWARRFLRTLVGTVVVGPLLRLR